MSHLLIALWIHNGADHNHRGRGGVGAEGGGEFREKGRRWEVEQAKRKHCHKFHTPPPTGQQRQAESQLVDSEAHTEDIPHTQRKHLCHLPTCPTLPGPATRARVKRQLKQQGNKTRLQSMMLPLECTHTYNTQTSTEREGGMGEGGIRERERGREREGERDERETA